MQIEDINTLLFKPPLSNQAILNMVCGCVGLSVCLVDRHLENVHLYVGVWVWTTDGQKMCGCVCLVQCAFVGLDEADIRRSFVCVCVLFCVCGSGRMGGGFYQPSLPEDQRGLCDPGMNCPGGQRGCCGGQRSESRLPTNNTLLCLPQRGEALPTGPSACSSLCLTLSSAVVV